jgi:branched-subunit amino acid transport protein
MNVWLTILLGGVLTFAIRFSFIGALARKPLPAWTADALRFVPVAALSALIASDLAAPQPTTTLTLSRWLAGAVAALIAWKTRSVGWAVLGGMIVFVATKALAGSA